MGALQTKSPLERRNTIVRRSQRRSLHNLKPKVGQIQKKIRKFKDTETTENYELIKREIEHLKCDMSKVGKELQPQVRNLYENLYKGIRELEEALDKKLNENRDKKQLDDNRTTIQSGDTSNVNSNDGLEEVEIDEEQSDVGRAGKGDSLESESYSTDANAAVGKNTVELMAVKFEPTSKTELKLRSPEDKRKSILKVGGVPVMPGAMLDQLEASIQTNHHVNTTHSSANTNEIDPVTITYVQKINLITELLRETEMKISQFKGKKCGPKYVHFQNLLHKLMGDLNDINSTNEYVLDQVKSSKNYVQSCLNFLDERAELEPASSAEFLKESGNSGPDNVFINRNDASPTMIQGDNIFMGMKSTSV